MSWHIKKSDGSVFGPVELPILRKWAEEGRVAPEDELSQDQENWAPAPDLEELDMEWIVRFEDGTQYGPVHVMALRDPVRDGSIAPDTQIMHKERIDGGSVTDKLLPALAERVKAQEDDIARLSARVLSQGNESPGAVPTAFQSQLDEAERNVAELTDQLKAARQDGEQRTRTLENDVEQARLREEEMKSELSSLREKLRQADEAKAALAREAKEASRTSPGDENMVQAYEDLARNYDLLLDQLKEKSGEVKRSMAVRDEVEKHANERIRHLEDLLHREQAGAEKTRERLADLEETHFKTVKSFRELNDRFVRLKKRPEASPPVHAPPPGKVSAPAGKKSAG